MRKGRDDAVQAEEDEIDGGHVADGAEGNKGENGTKEHQKAEHQTHDVEKERGL